MSVLEVDVFPSKGLMGNLPEHLSIWKQREGSIFTTDMDKAHRDMAVNFIIARSKSLPIRVSLVMLDRIRPDIIYPTTVDGIPKVGFIHEDIFILFDRDDLRRDIREDIGETIYTGEQILNHVYN